MLTTIGYTYGDTNWKDKLTAYNGKAISYDAIGNPLSYDGWTYTWENGRQLKSLSNASTSLSFKYNSDGERTEKTVNGVTTKYTVFGDKVSFETTGSDKIHYSYDASGNLFSMNLNGTEYYYVRNAQGDITGLIDNAGNLVVSYTYDTWGKLIATTGNLASTLGVKNPYRYRGYRYDTETGLYYLQSRYYNPEWGRFVNADAYGGIAGTLLSHNMFGYVLNNPANMDDPSGHWPKIIEALSTIVSGGLMIATGLAGATAITLGGALITTAFLIIGIGTVAVGIAKTAAIAQGAKDANVDKINIQRNVINTFAGEKRGEVISAGVDLAMVGFNIGLGNKIVTQAPKTSINSAKVVVKSVVATLKKPSTYIKAWSNYTAIRSVIEGMNKFKLIGEDTYNKLIPIFDPSF